MRKLIKNNSGFTLVEMIIVIVVLAIISGVGVASMLSATDALAFLTIRTPMDQSADIAMSRMMQDIRILANDSSITIASATQFEFIDSSGDVIGYSLSGANLMRNTDILASDVSGVSFVYYDNAGNVILSSDVILSPNTNIRMIQITLMFQSGGYTFTYRSQVRPRNLKHISYLFS